MAIAIHFLRTSVAALAFVGSISITSAAESADLPLPEGPVILRVSGDITCANIGEEAHFDRAMLEAIGTRTITTSTFWTDGVQDFVGTPVDALLEALGVETGTVTATALNNYSVDIPVAHFLEGDAILAFDLNGAPMSVRDKGPIWVIYPFDSDQRFQSEVYHSRSIWQLDRLSVER